MAVMRLSPLFMTAALLAGTQAAPAQTGGLTPAQVETMARITAFDQCMDRERQRLTLQSILADIYDQPPQTMHGTAPLAEIICHGHIGQIMTDDMIRKETNAIFAPQYGPGVTVLIGDDKERIQAHIAQHYPPLRALTDGMNAQQKDMIIQLHTEFATCVEEKENALTESDINTYRQEYHPAMMQWAIDMDIKNDCWRERIPFGYQMIEEAVRELTP